MFQSIFNMYEYAKSFLVQEKIDPNINKFYYLSLLKNNENNTWHIHGLWPQYNKNSYPTYCGKVSFDISKLNPIIQELDEYWYADGEKDSDFWKHEYEKHGSCVFTPITEFDYFNTTVNLYKKAVKLELPTTFYNSKTKKCLIPVNLQFEFINDN